MGQYLVYMTAGSEEEALRIANQLVAEKLAACVNILGPIRSLYWWDGAVQDDSEIAFFAKTSEERFPALEERVRALHSYETPCVVALPIGAGNADFLAWILASTGPGSGS